LTVPLTITPRKEATRRCRIRPVGKREKGTVTNCIVHKEGGGGVLQEGGKWKFGTEDIHVGV